MHSFSQLQTGIEQVSEHGDLGYDQVFDALCYVRSGSIQWFEQIVDQIALDSNEAPRILTDRFLRNLEVTGHISVERNERLQAIGWKINQTSIVGLHNGNWILVVLYH